MAHKRKDTLYAYGFHRGPHLTRENKRKVAKAERRIAKRNIVNTVGGTGVNWRDIEDGV